MYFEESLEPCGDMATRFEESIESVTLSESSSIAEWDCENEESAWKVHIQNQILDLFLNIRIS